MWLLLEDKKYNYHQKGQYLSNNSIYRGILFLQFYPYISY